MNRLDDVRRAGIVAQGLAITGGTGAKITKNAISGNGGAGIDIGGGAARTTVAKNQVGRNGTGPGIRVADGVATAVVSNLVFDADTANILLGAAANATVRKNVVRGGEGDGILVAAPSTGVSLEGNLASGHAGIGIGSLSPSVAFKRNRSDGNGVGFESTVGDTDAGANAARGNLTNCTGPVSC